MATKYRETDKRYRPMSEPAKPSVVNRHGITPGDVFVASWGYDQTNVNAYQVVRTTSAGAYLVPIRLRAIDDSSVVPVPDSFSEWYGREPERAFDFPIIFRRSNPGAWFRISHSQTAFAWDGSQDYYRTPWYLGR